MPAEIPPDRIRASLLLGAVGDALGAGIEFDSLPAIRARFGEAGLREPAPCYGRRVAITDDTQMTLFTAEGLVRAARAGELGDRDSRQRHLLEAYLRWLETQEGRSAGGAASRGPGEGADLLGEPRLHAARAPGLTCLSALRAAAPGRPERAPNDSKGCGGVMRVAPVGLVAGIEDPFEAGCDAAGLTHGHPTGQVASGAFALLVARLVRGAALELALGAVEDALAAHPRARGAAEETLRALRRAREEAAAGPPTPEAAERVGAGWIAEEALAVAVYAALALGARDPQAALLLAVNHGGDSDSTGAICGNVLGAMGGAQALAALPDAWLRELELADVIERVGAELAELAAADYADSAG